MVRPPLLFSICLFLAACDVAAPASDDVRLGKSTRPLDAELPTPTLVATNFGRFVQLAVKDGSAIILKHNVEGPADEGDSIRQFALDERNFPIDFAALPALVTAAAGTMGRFLATPEHAIWTSFVDDVPHLHAIDRGTAQVRTVAKGISGLGQMIADVEGDFLYASAKFGESIVRIPLRGQGTPEVLFTESQGVASLAVDEKRLYWVTATRNGLGDIKSLDLDTRTATVVARDEYLPQHVLPFGRDLFWMERDTSTAHFQLRRSRDLGEPVDVLAETMLASMGDVGDFRAPVLADGHLYWMARHEDGLAIRQLALDSGVATTVALASGFSSNLSVDGGFVYWLEDGTPTRDEYRGELLRIPLLRIPLPRIPLPRR